MLRPDLALLPTRPTEQSLRPASPAQPVGGGMFGAVFRETRREVIDFIENGSGSRARALPVAVPFAAEPADEAAAPRMSGQPLASLRMPGKPFAAWQTPEKRLADTPLLSPEGEVVRRAAKTRVSPPVPPAEPATAATPARPRVDRAAQQEFIAAIAPAAQAVAGELGVAPELVVAHAALESGWGRWPLRGADGRTTHNLFGIKAGEGWQGAVVRARTTEFDAGVPVKREDAFRSYADAQSAFRDYARLLIDNPRYAGALQTGDDARAFAEGLVRGGYATDPAYADKLTRVAAQIRLPQ